MDGNVAWLQTAYLERIRPRFGSICLAVWQLWRFIKEIAPWVSCISITQVRQSDLAEGFKAETACTLPLRYRH
jgi:hypothetical protein